MSQAKKQAISQYRGTGRRKTSVARVILRPGTGSFRIKVNNKRGLPARSLEEFFGGRRVAHMLVKQPLVAVDMVDAFDIFVNVNGSGPMGQAGAMRHGITLALLQYDAANTPKEAEGEDGEGEGSGSSKLSFRRILRKAGYVTRDARIVERKKVGRRKARKLEQYSKR